MWINYWTLFNVCVKLVGDADQKSAMCVFGSEIGKVYNYCSGRNELKNEYGQFA